MAKKHNDTGATSGRVKKWRDKNEAAGRRRREYMLTDPEHAAVKRLIDTLRNDQQPR